MPHCSRSSWRPYHPATNFQAAQSCTNRGSMPAAYRWTSSGRTAGQLAGSVPVSLFSERLLHQVNARTSGGSMKAPGGLLCMLPGGGINNCTTRPRLEDCQGESCSALPAVPQGLLIPSAGYWSTVQGGRKDKPPLCLHVRPSCVVELTWTPMEGWYHFCTAAPGKEGCRERGCHPPREW